MAASVDGFSLATIPLVPLYNDRALGNATGFVWLHEGQHFLITNWHVVSGRSAETGHVLHEMGGIPNKLGLYLKPSTNTFGWYDSVVDLIDPAGQPLWFVHPSFSSQVDVVAVKLAEPPTGSRYLPINIFQLDALQIDVGMDVFVLGYPFGFKPPGMPVWKRGSVASEPSIAPLTERFILVDTASRPGMSGAPVIRRSWATHMMEGGDIISGPRVMTSFVGVYSGRLHTKDQGDAQLARVWPRMLIEEIFSVLLRDQPRQ
ncbi:MAG: trypsin-like peptidase domain-containing protein [Bradyrhizobium sp.]|nr:trypsin-like peptidase domain-containing protein [Bradyrhizobium sp.]